MRTSIALPLAALLTLGLPIVAQEEESEAYFSLMSNRTFAPGEKATVQLWASGIPKFQFRLYRVNDPFVFFEQRLQDLHEFGGRAPRPEKELTALERFHLWKRTRRVQLRNLFRRQFSGDSRSRIRAFTTSPARPQPGPSATEFAAIPVLNRQQLVATWDQATDTNNRWDAQTIGVPAPGPGLYLLEATDGKLQAYTLVTVSNLAVVAKGTTGRVLARVMDRSTGAPRPDAEVVVLSKDRKKRYAAARTDANGLLDAKVEEERIENVLILARTGDSFAATDLYGWNIASSPERSLAGYVYTDRPVYRPGHAVHYRAILRTRGASGYQMPPPGEFLVEVRDPEGKPVHRQRAAPNAFGALAGDFTLSPGAALGYHMVEVHYGSSVHTGGFQVEEYRKPEYEVRVTPSARRVLQGQPLEAVIHARYYFGEPVADAKVKWVIHRSRYWPPFYASDEDEEPREGDEGEFQGGDQDEEKSGQLDAEGKLTISIPTRQVKFDERYRIEARVTDAAGREIPGAGAALATIGNHMLRIEPEQYVYAPGDSAGFTVEARDYDNKPVPGISFRAEIGEYRWREAAPAPYARAEGQTGADGKARVVLPVRSGSLVARAVSRTPEGRDVSDSSYVWVSGAAGSFGPRAENIQIIPDKKSYRPGETARLLVVPGVAGAHLWIGIEGKALHESRFLHARDAAITVEVPIRREFAPNFFVQASMIRNGQLRQGARSIKVPPLEQQLDVQLEASKSEYRPGEPGTYTITSRDHAGRPAQAEFSLGIVDEAIYAIRRESAQEILSFFYGRDYNSVNTASSLGYYFRGEAGKRRMQLARIRPFGSRAQLKPERPVGPKVRKAFPDTMFWTAALRTDAQGRAQALVDFPDALTTWRATARGITADTRAGSAVLRTVVRKNLLVRLGTPRFLRDGDSVTVPVIVQNFLASEKKVQVSLAAQGADIVEGAPLELAVASRASAVVPFRLKPKPGVEVTLLAKAITAEESDAVEIKLPVVPFGVRMADSRSGALQGASAAEFDIEFPAAAAPHSRSLDITVTPSVAGAIFGALDYLSTFPYGCTEQTMSSFLPNVLVLDAIRKLGVKPAADNGELARRIQSGLERLSGYQHEDGGWGWWMTDDSQVFMTAYVVAGLAQARAAGVTIRQDSLDRGVQWLRSRSAEWKDARADLRAYVAYARALAGVREGALLDALAGQTARLSPYSLALTGLAFDALKDNRATAIASQLESRARSNAGEAWWDASRDDLMDFDLDTSPEATAFAVKLLSRHQPKSPLLPKAALYLVNHRGEGNYWSSTKQTAMVIYGLMDYLAQGGELKPALTATVSVNGKPVLTRRFTDADALSISPVTLRLPADALAPGLNRVRVVSAGSGRLYWSARGNYHSTAGKLQRTGTVALNVLREYFRLSPDKEKDRVVYRLEPLAGAPANGDVLAVRLTVTGGSWRYLMVEDPIPAGAEAIERDEVYQLRDRPPWWGYFFTRRELRDDRAAFFQTYFDRGQVQYVYLLKVVNAGQFHVSPARVEPMYQPRFLATTEPATLEFQGGAR